MGPNWMESTSVGYAEAICIRDDKGRLFDLEFTKANSRLLSDPVFGETLLGSRATVVFPPDFSLSALVSQGEARFFDSLSQGFYRFIAISSTPSSFSLLVLKEREEVLDVVEKDRFIRTLLRNMPGFVYRCRWDRDWTMEFLEGQFEAITGYKKEEVLFNGQVSFNDLIAEEYRAHLWEQWAELIPKQGTLQEQYQLVHKDGTARFVEERGLAVFDEKGEVLALEGYVFDITQRKGYEKRLEEQQAELGASNRMLNLIMDTIPGGIFWKDREYRYLGCNKLFAKDIAGRDPSFVVGKDDFMLNKKEDAENFRRDDELVMTTGKPLLYYEEKQTQLDGKQVWLRTAKVPILEEAKVLGLVGVYFDITHQKKIEQELLEEKERLRITLESIGEGVISTDAKGIIVQMNSSAKALTEWSGSEALGREIGEVLVVTEDGNAVCFTDLALLVVSSGEGFELKGDLVLKTRRGREISIADSIAPIRDPEGRTVGTVIVFRDITREKLEQEAIAYMSYHDALTGLYNRGYLEQALPPLQRLENLPLSVIIGDVNGLKMVNDVFGHEVGDEMIKGIAQVLQSVAGTSDVVARFGGDEFILLLPNSDEDRAERVCQEIRAQCRQHNTAGLEWSIALGFATKRETDELKRVMKVAEDQMYENKLIESRSVHSSVSNIMVRTLFNKGYESEDHVMRLRYSAFRMGIQLELSRREMDELRLLCMLHDIGKVAVNDAIWLKNGSLTAEEWQEVRRHPELGYRIVQSVPELSHVADLVLSHHEWWNGSGYPRGLKGEGIPLLCRIHSIVEAFDVMTNRQPYRAPIGEAEALLELERCAGIQFDKRLVKVFRSSLGIVGFAERF